MAPDCKWYLIEPEILSCKEMGTNFAQLLQRKLFTNFTYIHNISQIVEQINSKYSLRTRIKGASQIIFLAWKYAQLLYRKEHLLRTCH